VCVCVCVCVLCVFSELTPPLPFSLRSEFCWLVEPAMPRLEGLTGTGVVLSWQGVKFCGFQPPVSFELAESGGSGVQYEIELSEAHAYKVCVCVCVQLVSNTYLT